MLIAIIALVASITIACLNCFLLGYVIAGRQLSRQQMREIEEEIQR